MKTPFIWAHRGASSLAPENTTVAFAAAVDAGADGLELDVHLSADDIPVVIHDETLDRTTDGTGPVKTMSWGELQAFDAGSWFGSDFEGLSVPSLEEILQEFGNKLLLNLELKEFRAGVAVLNLLCRYASVRVVVSSFNHNLLIQLKEMEPKLPIAVLYDSGSWHKAVALAVELNALSFNPRADLVTRTMVSRCHRENLPVYAWTVDDASHVRRLLRAGVDGFFANDPLKARSAAFRC